MATIPLDLVLGPLSAAFGLSVGVERTLELLKNLVEPRIGSAVSRRVPDITALRDEADGLEARLQADAESDASELDERISRETVLVEDATDADDGDTARTLVLLLLGCAVGIVLARIFNVQLFHALLAATQSPGTPVGLRPALDYVLTGLLIGGGSGPIHVLIRFVTQRRLPPAEAEPQQVTAPPEAPAVAPIAAATPALATPPRPVAATAADPAAEEWPELAYDGGVDRDALEDVHRRSADPNLIVFHHTAMHMNSTFDDVVRVIRSRTDSRGRPWITGYHCVVLGDGSIHPFCRWDRLGTHAAGFNDRSLGLAFNGNFETSPRVPFSNPVGRYGPSRPTTAQLEAGAKVVALWTFLYPDIPADFATGILPHKALPRANKPCPGSQFPYEEFRALVEHYRDRWARSPYVLERIAEFRLKPFLYAGRPFELGAFRAGRGGERARGEAHG